MTSSWLRRLGIGLLLLVLLLLLTAGGVVGVGEWRLRRFHTVVPQVIAVPEDPVLVARGDHLARAITKCVDCHGEDLGGAVMDMGPVARLRAPNLTSGRGGVGPKSDQEWVRALRHGLRADGRPLIFMPSDAYTHLDAADLAATLAWLKSLPPVDRELPETALGPLGRVFLVTQPTRWLPAEGIDHDAPIPDPIAPGPTAEYGRYLAVVGGCTICHGPDLKGGIQEGPPGTPVSRDLTMTGALSAWSEAEFMAALRTGVRPDGTVIDPFMPWQATRLMSDEEIRAVWAYLRTLKG